MNVARIQKSEAENATQSNATDNRRLVASRASIKAPPKKHVVDDPANVALAQKTAAENATLAIGDRQLGLSVARAHAPTNMREIPICLPGGEGCCGVVGVLSSAEVTHTHTRTSRRHNPRPRTKGSFFNLFFRLK